VRWTIAPASIRTSVEVPEDDRASADGPCRAAGAAPHRDLAAQPPALAELQANRRGYWALWIFLVLFVSRCSPNSSPTTSRSMCATTASPIFPVSSPIPKPTFGGDFETAADYRDPYLQKLIAEKGGYIVWPPIRYSYDTHNLDLPTPAPSKPTWMLTEQECKRW
jgi:microcin C transport system permease protein